MESITEVKDMVQFILRTDEIDSESSSSSDISVPVYDISAEEFLDFAQNAISSETKEGIVNAVSNLKRALDCENSYVGIVDIPTDEEMREMEQEYMQCTTRQTA